MLENESRSRSRVSRYYVINAPSVQKRDGEDVPSHRLWSIMYCTVIHRMVQLFLRTRADVTREWTQAELGEQRAQLLDERPPHSNLPIDVTSGSRANHVCEHAIPEPSLFFGLSLRRGLV